MPSTTSIAVLLSFAAASCALAAEETSSRPQTDAAVLAPQKNATEESSVVEQFVNLQDAAIATFLELGETLQGVKDKESADAAAPAVKMASEQLHTIITAVEELGEPTEAAQQAIMARIANVTEKNEIVERAMIPLLTLMMQNPPCMGSEELMTELGNLLSGLQGASGIEDEELEETAPLKEPDADEVQSGTDSAE